MNESNSDIDWSKTTWEGSRREQLRRTCKLTLRERLLAVEDMVELSERLREMRLQRKHCNNAESTDHDSTTCFKKRTAAFA